MARFNAVKKNVNKTENLAGGEAYVANPKFEFLSILLTSFVQDQFYRSTTDTLLTLKRLLPQVGYEFAAKAAIYARRVFGMRSITHVVAGEIAGNVKDSVWATKFFMQVFSRPDDMLEIVSYYAANYGKDGKVHPLPNSLKRAIRKTLEGMDEYSLAKYRGEGRAIKMVDLQNLTHPKRTPALEKLHNGTLKSTETWETKLTQAGQKGETEEEVLELKKEAWKDMLEGNKMGGLALIRNCRNVITQAPELIPTLCKLLTDENILKGAQKKGKPNPVFPFQIRTAMDQISDKKVIKALSDAMDISLCNVPKFDGETLVVLDVSGSMGHYNNSKSPCGIGSLFAAALFKANDADVMQFGTDAAYLKLNPRDSLMSLAEKIGTNTGVGHGTDLKSIFNRLKGPSTGYDRIIILSDMQGWIGYDSPATAYNKYVQQIGRKPFIYSFDLQGYGTLQFPENNVFLLAGFSDRIFDVMALLEQDRDALVKEVDKTKF